MVECNCGSYGKPAHDHDGYHAHHCHVTQFEMALHEAEEPFYVDIPEFCVAQGRSCPDKRTPWPTLELAQGAMHRLMSAYQERYVVLYRGDVAIDMRIEECPILFEYRKKNNLLRDIQTGEKIILS
jgi:hypothetical protein